MQIKSRFLLVMKKQKGAVAIIVAILLVMLLGIAAMAIDIGYLAVTRNQLQNVADASALAAARQMGNMYDKNLVLDIAAIKEVAKAVALENVAAQKNIIVNNDDIVIGIWNSEAKDVDPNIKHPDAVEVTAFRKTGTNGPIFTFFASVLGIDTMSVSATATAALLGICKTEPGDVIPFGISKQWFERKRDEYGFCGQSVQFYPTSLDSCAGLHTYTWGVNAHRLKDIILGGWIEGTFPPADLPPWETGVYFNFYGSAGGEAIYGPFQELFELKKNADGIWNVKVPVYDSDTCDNTNQSRMIIGFAAAEISGVGTPPNMIIKAKIICDEADLTTGGCYNAGKVGAIPRLVQ